MIEVLPPSDNRAGEYQTKNYTEIKVLLPDGSVISAMPVTMDGGIAPDTLPLTALPPDSISVGAASVEALSANPNRRGCLLVNTSQNNISISFGVNDAVLYSGITLNPSGGAFWMDSYSFSIERINAIASGVSSNLAIQEFE